MLIKNLKVTEYTEDYYDEHKDAGLDYLGHGYWQEEYAKMVTQACQTPAQGFVLDAGCACGSILKGFQKLDYRVFGADLNAHMIELGQKHFGFYANELVCGSISELPVLTESVDLVHTAQVLEHIPQEHMDDILQEFARVLRPTGRLVGDMRLESWSTCHICPCMTQPIGQPNLLSHRSIRRALGALHRSPYSNEKSGCWLLNVATRPRIVSSFLA